MERTGLPHRRSIRLKEFDYTQNRADFVTICTTRRICLIGDIEGGLVAISAIGHIVAESWRDLPNHTQRLTLDASVIMPNHVHGIIILPGASVANPDTEITSRGLRSGLLGTVVGGFKSAVSRKVGAANLTLVRPIWQRNYYERIIRNDRDLGSARNYISNNPARWHDDPNHPRLHPAPNSPTRL